MSYYALWLVLGGTGDFATLKLTNPLAQALEVKINAETQQLVGWQTKYLFVPPGMVTYQVGKGGQRSFQAVAGSITELDLTLLPLVESPPGVVIQEAQPTPQVKEAVRLPADLVPAQEVIIPKNPVPPTPPPSKIPVNESELPAPGKPANGKPPSPEVVLPPAPQPLVDSKVAEKKLLTKQPAFKPYALPATGHMTYFGSMTGQPRMVHR